MSVKTNSFDPGVYFLVNFQRLLKSKIENTADWQQIYEDDKSWTNFMKPLIKQLGQDMGFVKEGEVSFEYFRVDVTFCRMDEDNISWNLEYAIELENSPFTWYQEVSKLCHINCYLRVLITYYESENFLSERLEESIRIMNSRQHKSQQNNWLLIFGPMQVKLKEKKPWRAFSIDNFEIRELPSFDPFQY